MSEQSQWNRQEREGVILKTNPTNIERHSGHYNGLGVSNCLIKIP